MKAIILSLSMIYFLLLFGTCNNQHVENKETEREVISVDSIFYQPQWKNYDTLDFYIKKSNKMRIPSNEMAESPVSGYHLRIKITNITADKINLNAVIERDTKTDFLENIDKTILELLSGLSFKLEYNQTKSKTGILNWEQISTGVDKNKKKLLDSLNSRRQLISSQFSTIESNSFISEKWIGDGLTQIFRIIFNFRENMLLRTRDTLKTKNLIADESFSEKVEEKRELYLENVYSDSTYEVNFNRSINESDFGNSDFMANAEEEEAVYCFSYPDNLLKSIDYEAKELIIGHTNYTYITIIVERK